MCVCLSVRKRYLRSSLRRSNIRPSPTPLSKPFPAPRPAPQSMPCPYQRPYQHPGQYSHVQHHVHHHANTGTDNTNRFSTLINALANTPTNALASTLAKARPGPHLSDNDECKSSCAGDPPHGHTPGSHERHAKDDDTPNLADAGQTTRNTRKNVVHNFLKRPKKALGAIFLHNNRGAAAVSRLVKHLSKRSEKDESEKPSSKSSGPQHSQYRVQEEDYGKHNKVDVTGDQTDQVGSRDCLARPKRLVNFLKGTRVAQVGERVNAMSKKPEKGRGEKGSSPPLGTFSFPSY